MSVVVETICPRCNHMSWEGEMTENNELQHCAKCKESFIFPVNGDEPSYFYYKALDRLAIWEEIRSNKKGGNFLKKLAKRFKL